MTEARRSEHDLRDSDHEILVQDLPDRVLPPPCFGHFENIEILRN